MEENNYKVFISAKAAEQIKIQLQKRGTPNAYLRLGVKGSGCNGYSYSLQYEDSSPRDKDLIFNLDGIKVVIDRKSILYLNGSTLDWEQTLMSSGYKFINPQEKTKCGCGESFTVI